VPNGVDFRAFSTPVAEPADLASIPHPRIGYAGVIKQQLDLALLAQVARRRPDWSLVMVGPIGMIGDQAEALRALQQLPNCHFTGRKSAAELPAYVQHFDVCTLGYVMDGYTRYIYPLKLHEYLAAGRPVVATHIPALEEFREVVYMARSAEDWVAAIEGALTENKTAAAARERIAAEHDWSSLVRRVATAIDQNLKMKGNPK
jgi:glycosyltransferase involved in cell wall biosynthesis